MKTVPGGDWRIWAITAAGAALAAGVAAFVFYRGPSDPDEAERRRRAHLNRVGRIVEGHVVDLVETPAPGGKSGGRGGLGRRKAAVSHNGHRRLVCYTYSISGVSYETAQDVTGLENHAGLDQLMAGQPASIKYDPANPSNSILIADDWSGVR